MGNCIIVQKSSSGSSYTAGNGIDITNDVVSNTAGMYTKNIGTYSGSPAVVNADLLEGHDSSYFITNQTLLHNRFLYSSSTPLVVTNGSKVIQSGTIEKVRSDTTLFFVFMCCGYVDSLSGGFYFFIDGKAVADATTIFTSANSMVFGCRFVDGISAGSHTFKITASTQGNNTFTVPAWTNSVITISEQY